MFEFSFFFKNLKGLFEAYQNRFPCEVLTVVDYLFFSRNCCNIYLLKESNMKGRNGYG